MWAPELAASGAAQTLGAEPAHHLVRVCRAREGDTVTLVDGRGGVALGELVATRPAVVVAVRERRDRPVPPARVLMLGAPEGERADWLVEKAVELGATAVWPVDTERASWHRAGMKRERWERLARAALGQSCRAWLPELAEPAPLPAALDRVPAGARRWLADVAGEPGGTRRLDAAEGQVGLVGPSAGLSPAERSSLIARGYEAIRLSDARLRAETAALALLAWWSASAAVGISDTF